MLAGLTPSLLALLPEGLRPVRLRLPSLLPWLDPRLLAGDDPGDPAVTGVVGPWIFMLLRRTLGVDATQASSASAAEMPPRSEACRECPPFLFEWPFLYPSCAPALSSLQPPSGPSLAGSSVGSGNACPHEEHSLDVLRFMVEHPSQAT